MDKRRSRVFRKLRLKRESGCLSYCCTSRCLSSDIVSAYGDSPFSCWQICTVHGFVLYPGIRMPFLSISAAFSSLRKRVSCFFVSVIQRQYSLRCV